MEWELTKHRDAVNPDTSNPPTSVAPGYIIFHTRRPSVDKGKQLTVITLKIKLGNQLRLFLLPQSSGPLTCLTQPSLSQSSVVGSRMVSIDVLDNDLPFSPRMSPHDNDEKTLNLLRGREG